MIHVLLFSIIAVSTNATEKLSQIHTNAKNASHNLTLWKENTSIAHENIDSISKALEQNRELQKKWKYNFDKVQSQLSELEKAEQSFDNQKKEEEALFALEQKQIKDLELWLDKVRLQHEKRKESLTNAQKFKDSYIESKKSLKISYEEQLAIRDDLVSQEKTLVQDGNEWAKKKQESERSVAKWQQLSEYHTKLKNNYDRLSENKD